MFVCRQNLDITKHRLVHEGLLSWRQNKNQKLMDLHVVLLEDLIMLLVKQDEKFVLKFFPVNTGTSTDKPLMYSPIIRTSTVLLRPVATGQSRSFKINCLPKNFHPQAKLLVIINCGFWSICVFVTDKRAFFLVNISQACSQIFELVALSNAERKS
jgi:PH domain